MMQLFSAIVGFIVAVGAYFLYDTYVAPMSPSADTEQSDVTQPLVGVSALSSLNRSGQNLTKISKDDILAMGNIQQLDLSNNQLTGALPAEIRFLSNLEALDISNNKMTGLPAELGQLSKLRILDVSDNQLTGIPHELGNLQNLEILNLSGNDISREDLQIIRSRLPASTQMIL
jgi:Leucine-rich repeat (LRR) protein